MYNHTLGMHIQIDILEENNQFVANEVLKQASARSSETKKDAYLLCREHIHAGYICITFACEIKFHSLYQDNVRLLNGSKQKHRKQQQKIQKKRKYVDTLIMFFMQAHDELYMHIHTYICVYTHIHAYVRIRYTTL